MNSALRTGMGEVFQEETKRGSQGAWKQKSQTEQALYTCLVHRPQQLICPVIEGFPAKTGMASESRRKRDADFSTNHRRIFYCKVRAGGRPRQISIYKNLYGD